MEFMIEQVIVLWLRDISFFAHGLPKQKIERTTVYEDPLLTPTITEQLVAFL
ncbi:hypothetical protein D3C86_891850 [compost metagenome]